MMVDLTAPIEPLTFVAAVELTSSDIRLRDVTDLSSLPKALRTRAQDIIVGRVRKNFDTETLGTQLVAERARAQLPALSPWLPSLWSVTPKAAISVTYVGVRAPDLSNPARRETCMRILNGQSAGSSIAASDVEPAPCVDARVAFVYDATLGLARARRDISPGEIVPGLAEFAMASVTRGQVVWIKTQVGPVVIERQVRSLRPARADDSVLVAAQAGRAFQVPAPADTFEPARGAQ